MTWHALRIGAIRRAGRAAVWAAALTQVACLAGELLPPRFSQEVAAALRREPMHHLQTPLLDLYYPAAHAAYAHQLATRLESCVDALRAAAAPARPDGAASAPGERLVVVLTSANFNNAYVMLPSSTGEIAHMVLPLHSSLQLFDLLNFGNTNAPDIACHEAVHYVQLQQISGFWRWVNRWGGQIVTPQAGLESWLWEGLAVYYEGKLAAPLGRTRSPFFQGVLEAGLASPGQTLHPGMLAPYFRAAELAGGSGPYLLGYAFVRFLAATYGEEKLWQLVHKQGDAWFFPFGVTLRFKKVYGRSIGALFQDFAAAVAREHPVRERPSGQRVLVDDAGYEARLATSPGPTSRIATISAGVDAVVRLNMHGADGALLYSRPLTQVLPGRDYVLMQPALVSGMSFSADGRSLYLVVSDMTAEGNFSERLWQIDAADGHLRRTVENLGGPGGSVSADGKYYYYVQLDGARTSLVRLHLETLAREELTAPRAGWSQSSPAVSWESDRVAFVARTPEGTDLFLWQPGPGPALQRLTHDGGFKFLPRWTADDSLLFVQETHGQGQVHRLDVARGTTVAVTEAPYVALDAAPLGSDHIVFLNRVGWRWSVDAVPAAAAAANAMVSATVNANAARAAAAVSAPATAEAEPQAPHTAPAMEVLPANSGGGLGAAAPAGRRDAPYSAWDGLWRPTLRLPTLQIYSESANGATRTRTQLGVALQGSDRLARHRWALNLLVDTRDGVPSGSVGYRNEQLAPWSLAFAGTSVRQGPVHDRAAQVRLGRTFWTTPLEVYFKTIDRQEAGWVAGHKRGRSQWSGVGVAGAFQALESTLYGGVRRGLRLAGGAAVYPRALASDFSLADVRGELGVHLAMPWSKRQSLATQLIGRTLLSQGERAFIWVGQRGGGLGPAASGAGMQARALGLGVPELEFAEALRAYEETRAAARSVAIMTTRYRVPLVMLDRGWASLLYLLPSFFVRQLDMELFFSGAALRGVAPASLQGNYGEASHLWLGAAGAALALRCATGPVPWTLYYQMAHRFDRLTGPGWSYWVGLKLD